MTRILDIRIPHASKPVNSQAKRLRALGEGVLKRFFAERCWIARPDTQPFNLQYLFELWDGGR